MKKINLIFTVLAVFTLILAACSDDNTNATGDADSENTETLEYEPEEINTDTDVCEVCGMSIEDDEYATEVILENDKVLKFDDLGDLYVWLDESENEKVEAKFVRDFNTKDWIQLEDATFVYDEEISTPMGFGVISFKDTKDAEAYIDDNSFGDLLTAEDLDNHEWDVDDDHEGHDNHDHGFDTEGFDMHFTEPEDVTVGEEMELEVSLTIDEEALEDANVRYEIWVENHEDNTDWEDADENDTGIYVADYAFEENGTYRIQIHVEDDKGLHEHMEYEVNVKE